MSPKLIWEVVTTISLSAVKAAALGAPASSQYLSPGRLNGDNIEAIRSGSVGRLHDNFAKCKAETGGKNELRPFHKIVSIVLPIIVAGNYTTGLTLNVFGFV